MMYVIHYYSLSSLRDRVYAKEMQSKPKETVNVDKHTSFLLLLWCIARLRQLRDVWQIGNCRLAFFLVVLDDRWLSRLARHLGDWLGCSFGLLPLLVAKDRVVVAGDCAGGAGSFSGGCFYGEALFLETHFAAALVAVPEHEEQNCRALVTIPCRCENAITYSSQPDS